MHFHSGFVSSFAFASTVLAHSVERSRPFTRAEQVTYNNFHAGIVLSDIPTTVQLVTSTFIAPWMSGSPGSGVNIFTAIDGERCNNVSLRAGVEAQINDDGFLVYTPYYRWYPDDMQTFENVTVEGGDTITVFVEATGVDSGSVTIINNNKGQYSVQNLTSSAELCLAEVMWLVEPPFDVVNSAFYPLADFLSISFGNTWALNNSQVIFPTYSPETPNIVVNNQAVTTLSIQDAGVTVINLSY